MKIFLYFPPLWAFPQFWKFNNVESFQVNRDYQVSIPCSTFTRHCIHSQFCFFSLLVMQSKTMLKHLQKHFRCLKQDCLHIVLLSILGKIPLFPSVLFTGLRIFSQQILQELVLSIQSTIKVVFFSISFSLLCGGSGICLSYGYMT